MSVPRELRGRVALLVDRPPRPHGRSAASTCRLGPSLAAELLHSPRRAIGGLVVFSAHRSWLVRDNCFSAAGRTGGRAIFGSACMVAGLLLVLFCDPQPIGRAACSLSARSSSAAAWGPSLYGGAFRAIAAARAAATQGRILATLFFVNYLFFQPAGDHRGSFSPRIMAAHGGARLRHHHDLHGRHRGLWNLRGRITPARPQPLFQDAGALPPHPAPFRTWVACGG